MSNIALDKEAQWPDVEVTSELEKIVIYSNILTTIKCLIKVPSKLYFVIYSALFVVDGGCSNWSNWTECSLTCGGGTREKHRTCDNPEPQNGGKDCDGLGESVTENCNLDPCPGKPLNK